MLQPTPPACRCRDGRRVRALSGGQGEADGIRGRSCASSPLCVGSPFRGRLDLEMGEPRKVQEVRLELRVRADVTVSGGRDETITVWVGQLAGEGEFGGGAQSFEFAGQLPEMWLPTLETDHGRPGRSSASRPDLPATQSGASRARSSSAVPAAAKRGRHAGRRGPTDDVARGERPVDRGGGPQRVADPGSPASARRDSRRRPPRGPARSSRPRPRRGRRPAASACATSEPTTWWAARNGDAAPDQRVGDGRRGRVALGRGRPHPLARRRSACREPGHHAERRLVDRDRVEQRRDLSSWRSRW